MNSGNRNWTSFIAADIKSGAAASSEPSSTASARDCKGANSTYPPIEAGNANAVEQDWYANGLENRPKYGFGYRLIVK